MLWCNFVFGANFIYIYIPVYMLWCNFVLGANFIFLCFGCMVMYDNEF